MFPSNPFPILVICQAQELLSSFQVFDVEGTGHLDRPGVGQIIAWQHVTTFQLAPFREGTRSALHTKPDTYQKATQDLDMYLFDHHCQLTINTIPVYQSTWVGIGVTTKIQYYSRLAPVARGYLSKPKILEIMRMGGHMS